MRITVDEARPYFAHPSQQTFGVTPETLPDDPFEYWADGPVCGVFHLAPWPGVWMAHHAVKPEGWGHLDKHAEAIMREFSEEKQPVAIIGWTDKRNRAALAFARRIGFREGGDLPFVMTVWRG